MLETALLTVDAFCKVGAVGVTKVAVEETYEIIKRGNLKHCKFDQSLEKMCKEGAYWGTVAGVYVGLEYGAEKIRGTRDWKNAMIGGALTGLVVSAGCRNDRDKIISDTIAGGAVATAAELLSYIC